MRPKLIFSSYYILSIWLLPRGIVWQIKQLLLILSMMNNLIISLINIQTALLLRSFRLGVKEI